ATEQRGVDRAARRGRRAVRAGAGRRRDAASPADRGAGHGAGRSRKFDCADRPAGSLRRRTTATEKRSAVARKQRPEDASRATDERSVTTHGFESRSTRELPSYETLLLECVETHVLVVTLNRPQALN